MKATLLIIVMILLTSMIFAQEFAIRQASNIQFQQLSIKGNNNQTFVIWEDAAGGNTQIFVHKLNASGETLWNDPLSFGQASVYNYAIAVTRTSDNANLVLYSTNENLNAIFYLAKFDDNGNIMWTLPSVVVNDGIDTISSIKMTANAVGGAYIVYTNNPQDTSIKGVNIDGEGNHLWTPGGHILANFATEVSIRNTHPDGQGGLILNCYLLAQNYSYITHLIRISATAEVLGSNPLVPYNSFSMPQAYTVMTSDGNLVLYNFTSDMNIELLMQKIDVLGNPIGNTAHYNLQNYGQGRQIVVRPNLSGGVAIAWRYEVQQSLVTMAQNFNENLQAQWEPTGVWINNPSFDYHDLDLVVGETGGIWVNSCERVFYVNQAGFSVFGGEGLNYSQYSFKRPLMIGSGANLSLFWREELNRQLSLNRQVFTTSGNNLFPTGGSPIISHLAGFAAGSQTFALGDRYITIWQDSRIGGKDTKICFQVLDSNGQILLEPNGRELNPAFNAPEYVISAKMLGNNKLAILYGVYSTNGGKLLQVIDLNGNKLIPDYGLPIGLSDNIMMDSYQEDLYFGWVSETGGFRLMGQRVSNFQKQWGENGIALIDFPASTYAYLSSVCGRYFIFNLLDYNVSLTTTRAVLVSPNGSIAPAWQPYGLQMAYQGNPFVQQNISSTIMGEDLITIIQNYSSPNETTLVQRTTPAGQHLWTEAGIQIPLIANQFYTSELVVDEDISFVYRAGNNAQNLCYQRISGDGAVLYGTDNLAILTDAAYFRNDIALTGFSNGTQIALYALESPQAYSYGYYTDIMAKYISTEGEPSWQVIPVCTGPYEQSNPSIASLGDRALASWTDYRVGVYSEDYGFSSIYARILNSGSTSTDDPSLTPLPWAELKQNYPNPFNPSTSIRFSLRENTAVSLDIYNIRGQLVKSLCRNQVFTAGNHELVWNGLDERNNSVSSGVYYYRLLSEGRAVSKRMVLSK